MSYTKHNWVNGETITDTLLNHIEDGIGNSQPLTVGADLNTHQLNKTFGEIFEAFKQGRTVVVDYSSEQYGERYAITRIVYIQPAYEEEPYRGTVQDTDNRFYEVTGVTVEELYNEYPTDSSY